MQCKPVNAFQTCPSQEICSILWTSCRQMWALLMSSPQGEELQLPGPAKHETFPACLCRAENISKTCLCPPPPTCSTTWAIPSWILRLSRACLAAQLMPTGQNLPVCQALEMQPRVRKIPAVWQCFCKGKLLQAHGWDGTSQSSLYIVIKDSI